MRRFDKLKVIKEANQILENKFLTSKSIILEQGDEPDNTDSNPTTSDFKEFKKDLSLKGDENKASGTIPGGNGKKITITSDGKYTIFNVDNTENHKGEFKTVGIWPGKHIELKPDGGKNFLKLKNILSDLDKQPTSSDTTDFFNNFKNLVKNPKNLTTEQGYYSYAFYTNKKSDVVVSVHMTINTEDKGETGTFEMSWKSPTKSGTPPKWTGTFSSFGETFISDDPKQVGSIDKSGKIDSGLIKILSVFWPKYND